MVFTDIKQIPEQPISQIDFLIMSHEAKEHLAFQYIFLKSSQTILILPILHFIPAV